MARINGSRNVPERNLDVNGFAEKVGIPSIELPQLTSMTKFTVVPDVYALCA